MLFNANIEIGNAENNHDFDYLRKVLSDDLEFHRADGITVNNKEYMIQLKNRTYDDITTEGEDFFFNEEGSVTTIIAMVKTTGTSKAILFEVVFRNERIWKKEANGR